MQIIYHAPESPKLWVNESLYALPRIRYFATAIKAGKNMKYREYTRFAGDMAWLVKCLLHKHEDVSWDLQHPRETPVLEGRRMQTGRPKTLSICHTQYWNTLIKGSSRLCGDTENTHFHPSAMGRMDSRVNYQFCNIAGYLLLL